MSAKQAAEKTNRQLENKMCNLLPGQSQKTILTSLEPLVVGRP